MQFRQSILVQCGRPSLEVLLSIGNHYALPGRLDQVVQYEPGLLAVSGQNPHLADLALVDVPVVGVAGLAQHITEGVGRVQHDLAAGYLFLIYFNQTST